MRDSPLKMQEARDLLGLMLFRGDDVFKLVGDISGGERSRLALSRLMTSRANLLLLDEPTNHLDIPSREALEEALDRYQGTLIFASHDRRLISRLAGGLWVVEAGRAAFRLLGGVSAKQEPAPPHPPRQDSVAPGGAVDP
jgi:ATP-binding cassette subfamily F protein 3